MDKWLYKLTNEKINWIEFNSFTCCRWQAVTLACTQVFGVCLFWVFFLLPHFKLKTNTTFYCWVTLTYSNENVALSDLGIELLGCTCIQSIIKRRQVLICRCPADRYRQGQNAQWELCDFLVFSVTEPFSSCNLWFSGSQDTMYASNTISTANIPGNVENQTNPCSHCALKTNSPQIPFLVFNIPKEV